VTEIARNPEKIASLPGVTPAKADPWSMKSKRRIT
jgi:hypothetical protein